MIKVSIVVPVFNVEKYLEECLESICSQSLREIEIICGDGGSTDNSLSIIQKYAEKDSRVKFISVKGSGYGQSMNDCMQMAQGEYIGIVESDDKVVPEMYEELYKIAHDNDLDWVRGDIFYYRKEENNEILERESILYGAPYYNVVLNPQVDYGPYKSGMRTWSGIYKRDFLNKYDIRHNETPGGSYQDVGFYLKTLYYATRVYFVDKPYYMWRQDNPNSSIHYDEEKLAEKSLNEWKLNWNYLIENNLGKRAIASYNYRKFFSYRWTAEMTSGKIRDRVIKTAYKELSEAYAADEIDRNFYTDYEWEAFQLLIKEKKFDSIKNQIQRFQNNNPTFKTKVIKIINEIKKKL